MSRKLTFEVNVLKFDPFVSKTKPQEDILYNIFELSS